MVFYGYGSKKRVSPVPSCRWLVSNCFKRRNLSIYSLSSKFFHFFSILLARKIHFPRWRVAYFPGIKALSRQGAEITQGSWRSAMSRPKNRFSLFLTRSAPWSVIFSSKNGQIITSPLKIEPIPSFYPSLPYFEVVSEGKFGLRI